MNTQEYFKEVCDKIKSYGFRVFVKKDKTYGYFSDGKGVGYFQLEWDGYDGVSLTTVNAKGSGCSGFSVKGESGGYALDELTDGLLRKAFVTYPDWVSGWHVTKSVKYRDLEHFLSEYWDRENLIEL